MPSDPAISSAVRPHASRPSTCACRDVNSTPGDSTISSDVRVPQPSQHAIPGGLPKGNGKVPLLIKTRQALNARRPQRSAGSAGSGSSCHESVGCCLLRWSKRLRDDPRRPAALLGTVPASVDALSPGRGGGTRRWMAAAQALSRLQLAGEGFLPVLALASAGVSTRSRPVAHGSGLLAVFIAGIVLVDARLP